MRVIIVGGGIAGLSTGIALRRGGHNVTIIEQSSFLHEVGAAISIAPNASPVLRGWGFDIAKAGMVPIKRASTINGVNMETMIRDYHVNIEERFGAPIYAVHRVDLHSQLRELAVGEGERTPCQLQLRSKVIGYNAANASITLADGSTLQADLIVAADGVHSIAKDAAFGKDELVARETGWASMRWLLPTEDILSDPNTAPLIEPSTIRFFSGQSRSALVWYMCRNEDVQNFLYMSRDFASAAITEDFHAGVDASMVSQYAKNDFSPELQAVLAFVSPRQEDWADQYSKAKEVKFWKLIAREPIPTWHKDSLVLVGDAAHPMLPFQAQGGSQAIEDAAALGVLLDGVEDKQVMKKRLELYQQIRHDRGSSLQLLSNGPPPLPQSTLEAVSRYLPEGVTLRDHADIVEYIFSYDVASHTKEVLAKSLEMQVEI